MKIRLGFISNSSSTSFVVGFPVEPKNIEDIKTAIFSTKFNIDYNHTEDEIATRILESIERQTKNDLKNLTKRFTFKGKEFFNLKKDIESNPNKSYYFFNFSSDCGDDLDESLRYGEVFRHLKYYIENLS